MNIKHKIKHTIRNCFGVIWRVAVSIAIVTYSNVYINRPIFFGHKDYYQSYQELQYQENQIIEDKDLCTDETNINIKYAIDTFNFFNASSKNTQVIYTDISTKEKEIIKPQSSWLGSVNPQEIRLLFNKNKYIIVQHGEKAMIIGYNKKFDNKDFHLSEIIISYSQNKNNSDKIDWTIQIKSPIGMNKAFIVHNIDNSEDNLKNYDLQYIQEHSYLGISRLLKILLDFCGKLQHNWWLLVYPGISCSLFSYLIYKQAVLKNKINSTYISTQASTQAIQSQEMEATIKNNSTFSNTLIAMIPSVFHLYYITHYFHLSHMYYAKSFGWLASCGNPDTIFLLPSFLRKFIPISITPTILLSVLWGSWFIQQDKILSNGFYRKSSALDYIPLVLFYYSWAVSYPAGSIYLAIIFNILWHSSTNIIAYFMSSDN